MWIFFMYLVDSDLNSSAILNVIFQKGRKLRVSCFEQRVQRWLLGFLKTVILLMHNFAWQYFQKAIILLD